MRGSWYEFSIGAQAIKVTIRWVADARDNRPGGPVLLMDWLGLTRKWVHVLIGIFAAVASYVV